MATVRNMAGIDMAAAVSGTSGATDSNFGPPTAIRTSPPSTMARIAVRVIR